MTDPKRSTANVILIGASTRAAAMSALLAGVTPWCADLFADADLERIAMVRKVPAESYPLGLLAALAEMPPAPVIYTGALENRPDLIARIDRPLWGNPPDVLRAIRSPQRWTKCLREHGILCPAIADEPTAGRWLLKPCKSAGGFGIQVYAGQTFNARTHFLQEWIDGVSCSAVYLSNADGVMLLGVTRQFVGTSWLHASGFHYAGSIGPAPLDEAATSHWTRIGMALARSFHLRGLFGVDAVMRDGVPWPVEINPRYTASVEVLERAGDVALLGLHRRVFDSASRDADRASLRVAPSRSSVCGKAILFATAPLTFPASDFADCADIPHAGETIPQGRPVLTLFASAETIDDCCLKLWEKAQTLDRMLWG